MSYVTRDQQYEHRLVMEAHLGRPLRTDEHVHHIDGDKKNNDITNLELTTPSSHISRHHKGVKKTTRHRAKIAASQRKRWESMTPCEREEFSSAVRAGRQRRSPEERSAAVRKAWETRRKVNPV